MMCLQKETCSATDENENEDFELEALPDDAVGETVKCVPDQSVEKRKRKTRMQRKSSSKFLV